MDAQKQEYVSAIRDNTAYPVYRSMIDLVAMIAYFVAGILFFSGLFAGCMVISNSVAMGFLNVVIGVGVSSLVWAFARFGKEAALILADIGDSITEFNSRPR
jgi:hypothetical protein